MHESQSRLWENLVGRSLPFWRYFYPQPAGTFPAQLGTSTSRVLPGGQPVYPSLIRVEADEVTYNLHIILRFELESEMLDGDLKVDDLPEAWNSRISRTSASRCRTTARACFRTSTGRGRDRLLPDLLARQRHLGAALGPGPRRAAGPRRAVRARRVRRARRVAPRQLASTRPQVQVPGDARADHRRAGSIPARTCVTRRRSSATSTGFRSKPARPSTGEPLVPP